ncbi:hypothetical protein MKJ04_21000 [Pontibacter sp. E15-1]|uniref:hypothetical protein n=1 Tax=Pontibacter sp. E15-1 TaxID=2919918 RepID=UPI001F4F8AD0|nr:hypothetical protein [Pontibacter sp. E15-1]MCJ8167332.1 hypothetical protein [Pontibacter sp. E15-1]
MKKTNLYLLLVLVMPILTSCWETVDPAPLSAYQPILMSRTHLESSIKMLAPLPIADAGKLYKYGQYILVNERYKGVHLIDNKNPAAPVKLGFIQVPGSVDFAVKDNVLYVDNAVDLVAIDLRDLHTINIRKRVREAFPPLLAPDNLSWFYDMAGAPKDAVVVGWELRESK